MSYKVLIIDDSKLARMAIGKALGALLPDWTRIEAANADEAMNYVRQNQIDVALIDFNMPGGDGLTLAAELHALRPNMPLAVVSANHQQEIVTRARQAGATFLMKPVTEQALGQFFQEAILRLRTVAQ
jgi:DNA-binding NarL/FixJ family response regulator